MTHPTPAAGGIHGGITEADIANYLANTPGFFERHAELLASIQLTSPHGARAVSLQERQMEMLREKIKLLEQRIIEMIRHGNENMAIAERLHRFTREVLRNGAPAGLPVLLLASLQHEFMIPQACVRLWGVDEAYDGLPFTAPVSDDMRAFADSLALPYCGANTGFDAVAWLDDADTVASVAMIPLRAESPAGPPGADAATAGSGDTFGLLVLGSPDPTRYSAGMGTEFLMRIGEVAAAGLGRLLPNER